mmetsp:Transcript_98733/g.282228  ORF Transcript_98733/g.282228 Transcript_98733/m.282228 type:complete len:604 (+) Transcript_98733:215-2026(+)
MASQKPVKPQVPSDDVKHWHKMPIPVLIEGNLKKQSRGKSFFGKMSKTWAERYVVADPDAMMLTYKEGSAAGEIKGTFNLAGISVKAYECAEEPNAFEVTGTNNGVEEKLVLACPDEAEGQKWIAGLNKFAHTDKIKAAKEEVKVYKEKLAAYKEEVARISKARATDLMPKKKGEADFTDADAILRMAINQAATDKFVASGGKNAKHLDHKTTMQTVGDAIPPPPPHPNAQGVEGLLPTTDAVENATASGVGAYAVDTEKALLVKKNDKWQGAEAGTAIDKLPVNEWVTEVVAEVEDLNEAVLAARDEALQDEELRAQMLEEETRMEEEQHGERTGEQEQKRKAKLKAMFKQKVRMIILQNSTAMAFQDGLKNTIKQERIDKLINQGDNTDEARAIEKLLAKKKELKLRAANEEHIAEKHGTFVDASHAVREDFDISHEAGHHQGEGGTPAPRTHRSALRPPRQRARQPRPRTTQTHEIPSCYSHSQSKRWTMAGPRLARTGSGSSTGQSRALRPRRKGTTVGSSAPTATPDQRLVLEPGRFWKRANQNGTMQGTSKRHGAVLVCAIAGQGPRAGENGGNAASRQGGATGAGSANEAPSACGV